MKLGELAYFTDNVKGMTDFYRTLLGAESVTHSADMAIFMLGDALPICVTPMDIS